MGKPEMLDEHQTEVLELEQPKQAQPLVTQPQYQMTAVDYAMKNGASVAEIRELVALHIQMKNHEMEVQKRDDERAEKQRLLDAALAYRRDYALFRGENIIVPKTKHVDRGRGGSFSQAEYHVACDLLSPALSRHGFGFRHKTRFGTKPFPTADDPNAAAGWVWVTCFLDHKDGHTEIEELDTPMDDQSANSPAQNMQSMSSFLKRQTLLNVTGTATGGEDDENLMRRKEAAVATRDAGELDALIALGQDKAMSGMEALLAWWGNKDELSARNRTDLSKEFAGWRKVAAQADAKRGAA